MYHFHHQSEENQQVLTRATWHYTQEDGILHSLTQFMLLEISNSSGEENVRVLYNRISTFSKI
jgi:hypothetical protein